MANQTISEPLFRNPIYGRGWGTEYATAEKLAVYHSHGLFKLDELELKAAEPVKQAIKKRVAEWKEHRAKYGD